MFLRKMAFETPLNLRNSVVQGCSTLKLSYSSFLNLIFIQVVQSHGFSKKKKM